MAFSSTRDARFQKRNAIHFVLLYVAGYSLFGAFLEMSVSSTREPILNTQLLYYLVLERPLSAPGSARAPPAPPRAFEKERQLKRERLPPVTKRGQPGLVGYREA
jgi:hypothetical protein